MNATFEQIQNIVLNNPNKDRIKQGREMSTKLMLHVYGTGMESALKQWDYFEKKEVYDERKKCAMSNKDVFGRLLQQEDLVFSARGGSSYFSLPDTQEESMNTLLDDVRYNLSLRKWIRNFALPAYRCDPMGVIFIEVEQLMVDASGQMREPKPYPTYKNIHCIYDYLSTGRKLEYICFQLKVSEALSFGIQDEKLRTMAANADTFYFRFVDDVKDIIVEKKDGIVILTTNITQQNPLPNAWNRCPAFIVSDLIRFDDPKSFISPLDLTVELADTFLNDRSVRDLQKKYHGFAKAIEPLMTCTKCNGEGFLNGNPCPDCSIPGAEKGTGYKLKSTVADVHKFPLEILKDVPSFDYSKIFGYVQTAVETWEKQDRSLDDLEELMEMTYWGTIRMTRPKPGSGGETITATESVSNDQPREARLNMTADWAEKTESMIADYIGQYWFEGFKKSSISYGRDYILKSAEEYKDIYQELRTKGAPDSALDMAYRKWKQAEFKNNPVQLAIEMKKFQVEPFPHIALTQAKGIITDFTDYNCKLYFGEWANTIPEGKWAKASFTPVVLRLELKAYVEEKGIKEPAPEPKPNPSFN